MARVPYDTGDSIGWILVLRYGQYVGGVQWTDRRELTPSQLRKADAFEEEARALGYDPLTLEAAQKLELNVVLIKREQERLQW
jgi:hypothetical protein